MRAIHGAASSSSAAVVQMLLDHKATLNDLDLNGFSPFHNACMEGPGHLQNTVGEWRRCYRNHHEQSDSASLGCA